jgi:3-deoxy-D-manno-octulosonic-acid transferase
VLLPAFASVIAAAPDARLIVAPHEPTAAHLQSIERWAGGAGLSLARLDAANANATVVLVDRVGVLGDLYALGDVAFVGGGFHDAGLHSVLEPAAYGMPVLFGPCHANSRDARLLLDAGGARSVSDVPSTRQALADWLLDPGARQSPVHAARELVRSGLGAAERSFRLVEMLIGAA